MARKAAGLTTLALVALTSQAIAAVPSIPTPADLSRSLVSTGTTGLMADDLVVGIDGAVRVDVKTPGIKLACSSTDDNSGCIDCSCTKTNNGCPPKL